MSFDEWKSWVSVGGEESNFDSHDCNFTFFHGNVVRIHHNDTPITHISGGGGRIGTLYSGYTQGRIDPIKTHTEIKTDFKMWVRSEENKDFTWSSDYALEVAEGQELTLIFLNDTIIAYVNHNTNKWYYLCDDRDLIEMVGLENIFLTNQKDIDNHNLEMTELNRKRKDNCNFTKMLGGARGFLVGSLFYVTFLVNYRMGIDAFPYWLYLPALLFFLSSIVKYGSRWRFWWYFIFAVGIDIYSLTFIPSSRFVGLNSIVWALIINVFLLSILYTSSLTKLRLLTKLLKPKKEYKRFINKDGLQIIKNTIYANANYALKNPGSFR